MSESPEYKVELDAFSGPLDLLLYLIRRDEVDIWNIPIAHITEQYLRYIELMGELNINVAGEFIVMAATLIEIKSRMLAPDPEPMEEEEEGDPRLELVRQLMEYRRFKEAALLLNERAEQQAGLVPRAGEKPENADAVRAGAPAGVTIWALLDAFSKVLQQTGAANFHRLVIDRIPQEQIQIQVEEKLRVNKRATFLSLFEGEVDRGMVVGIFLAVLELVKQQAFRVEQEIPFGEIWITFVPPEERPVPDAVEDAQPLQPVPEGAPAESEEPYDSEWPEEEGAALPFVPDVEDIPEPSEDQPATPDTSDDEETEDPDESDDEDEYDDDDEDEDEEDKQDESEDPS